MFFYYDEIRFQANDGFDIRIEQASNLRQLRGLERVVAVDGVADDLWTETHRKERLRDTGGGGNDALRARGPCVDCKQQEGDQSHGNSLQAAKRRSFSSLLRTAILTASPESPGHSVQLRIMIFLLSRC